MRKIYRRKSVLKLKKSDELFKVLKELNECGFCEEPLEEEDGLYSTLPTLSWRYLALECSKHLGGQWHPQHNGIRWQNGHDTTYILNSLGLSEIDRVRQLTFNATGIMPGWAYGSCAKAFLEWALIPGYKDTFDYLMLDGKYIGYRECTPCHAEHGIHYDAKSCYFQLIRRLPSPRCNLDSEGKLRFHPMTPDEHVKWSEAKEILTPEKLLRNSVWGCMLGSTRESTHFHKGEEKKNRGYEGTHYPAAALVARSAWEMCRQVCVETDAVYAHTDGVIVVNGSKPLCWNTCGIEYRILEQGETHVVHHAAWCVGGNPTKHYDPETVFPGELKRPEKPQIEYHLRWLL